MKNNKYSLTIGWLYPDLMNTYGDRGNIIVLQKRAEWRGIKVDVKDIYVSSSIQDLASSDLIFMGGAQDTQQEIVNEDLQGKKGKTLIEKLENDTPGLFICGAYQFLGKYYKTADGKKLEGLGFFPLYTENPTGSEALGPEAGEKAERLIGNVIVKPNSVILGTKRTPESRQNLSDSGQARMTNSLLVGFENHGGRTHLEDKSMALGTVVNGHGNNATDKTEGIVYKNSFGTYLHGPILPKNPQLADLLLTLALEKKYGKKFHLEPLDDSIEQKARGVILEKF